MTKERSFKQLVRARMAKTGESYTAARAVLLQAAPPLAGAERTGAGRRPTPRSAGAPVAVGRRGSTCSTSATPTSWSTAPSPASWPTSSASVRSSGRRRRSR